ARDVDEADLGAAGCDGSDRISGPLRRHDGDIQAFVLEVTLAECDVPRRMPPQTYEVEDEFEVALLRLRGRRDEARRDRGGYRHACDQRSKHVCLLICQPAPSARPRGPKTSHPGGI